MIQILHPFIGSNYKWPRSASWFLTSATSWPKVQEKVVSLKLKEKMPSFKRCHSIFQPINFQGRSVSFRGSNLLNKAFLMEAFKFDSFSWGKNQFFCKWSEFKQANVVVSGKAGVWFVNEWCGKCYWYHGYPISNLYGLQFFFLSVRCCGCLCYRRIASTQRYTIRFHCPHLFTSLSCGKQPQSLAKKVWTKESMKIRFLVLPKILPGFLDQNLQQQWSCRVPRKGQYCKNNTIYLCERGHFAKVRNDFQFGNPTSLQQKPDVFCLFGLVWFCCVCFALVLFVCLFVCFCLFVCLC